MSIQYSRVLSDDEFCQHEDCTEYVRALERLAKAALKWESGQNVSLVEGAYGGNELVAAIEAVRKVMP